MTMLTDLTKMGKWDAIKTEYVATIFMEYADCLTQGNQAFVVIVHKLEVTSSTVEGSSNSIWILKVTWDAKDH